MAEKQLTSCRIRRKQRYLTPVGYSPLVKLTCITAQLRVKPAKTGKKREPKRLRNQYVSVSKLPYTQGVAGSSPAPPTIFTQCLQG